MVTSGLATEIIEISQKPIFQNVAEQYVQFVLFLVSGILAAISVCDLAQM